MILRLLTALLLLGLFFSCTVYREYPIEVYDPGEVEISPEATNVALVYRNFKYPDDTLLHYFKDNNQLVRAKNDPGNLDSILVNACLEEAATNLKFNSNIREVQIFPYHTFERHTDNQLPDIQGDLIEQITEAANVDLLISLETYSGFFSLYPASTETPEAIEVVSVAVWGIYDPVEKKRVERKTMVDTVFWNGYGDEGDYRESNPLPPRLTALQLASALAGENYAKRFYGSWQTVDRIYSVPPLPDFSEAAYYFEEGKWDRAIALWRRYAEEKNGKMAILARYNLALAHEMKDDIPSAQKWLVAAFDLAQKHRSKKNMQMIQSYQKVLAKRIQDF